jgi:hypothetical protein
MRIGMGMGMRQPTALTRIQAAIGELQRIPGAHVYLPGEGRVLGMRAGNYIDSAGTLPGVLDSPVGLVVDALEVLGPELVTNGDFSNDGVGWTFPGTFTDEMANFTGSNNTILQNAATTYVNGKIYKVTYTVSNYVSGSVSPQLSNGPNAPAVSGQTVGANGTHTIFLVSNGNTTFRLVGSIGPAATLSIDNVTVREITGIHASQNTTADKPVLKLTNDRYNWLFDTTDTLQLTLPAGYESATVIDATSAGPVTLLEQDVTGAYGIVGGLTTAELVTNGTFDTDTSGWTGFKGGSISWNADGTASVTADGYNAASTPLICVIGRSYKLEFETPAGRVYISSFSDSLATTQFATGSTAGKITGVFVATLATHYFHLSTPSGSGGATYDNISVKEILPSTHGRIILRDTPTARQLELCQGLANRLAGL